MGTTAQKLDRLLETKNGLREIINAKGVSVSEDDTFNSYINKVAAIPSDMAEATITANGTYRASDQGIDGFSSVIVNVDTGGSGGGGGASLGTKTITENGTYDATADGLDGYYSVEVEVPNTGTLIDKTITEVGTFNPVDDGADGYSSVTVDIDPETMAAPGDKFTVNFYIGDTLSLRVPNVPYGGMAEYPNASLIGTDPNYGEFYGWNPAPNNVRRNMNCYARFSQEARPIGVNEIYEPWEDIIADKGLHIPIGAYRYLHLGTVNDVYYGSIRMQKVYEGESSSTSTWLAMECPAVRKSMCESSSVFSDWDNGNNILRNFLNGDFFENVIPQVLKNAIVPVTKFSRKSGSGDKITQTLDSIWIPSTTELCLAQYYPGPYYSDIFGSFSQAANDTRKRYQVNDPSTYIDYFARDALNSYDGIGVKSDGSVYWNTKPNSEKYFVFGFCL